MFVFNVKVTRIKLVKIILAVMAIICVSLACVGIYKIYHSSQNLETFDDINPMPAGGIANLTDDNYANVLKEVHENLDTYIGQEICYTGYVYRVPELEDNEFVLARDMQLEGSNQTVIVGFLCSLPNAQDYENYAWVKITGTIEKGYYFGDIPCIHITEIERTKTPENCVVPAPSENFIETSVLY